MTLQEISSMVESIGLPYAYYQFSKESPVVPPFICFFYPNNDDLKADNINYSSINALSIELYTDEKRFDLESAVESALTANGLAYSKEESYIDTERMFQIAYDMEVVING